jgi:septal ring factor EnvC (AmiA/AmiB activator)
MGSRDGCLHCKLAETEAGIQESIRATSQIQEERDWAIEELEAEREENNRLRRELEEALNIIDRGCNALQDSICASGNDPQTNLAWIKRMRKEARRLVGDK